MHLEVAAVVVRQRRVQLYLAVGSQHGELGELVLADHPLLLVGQSHRPAPRRHWTIIPPAIRSTGSDSSGATFLLERRLRMSRRRLPMSELLTRYLAHWS